MAGSTRNPGNRGTRNLSGEAALFASLVSIAASQDSPEAAMQECLRAVCEFVGWPVGHLYVVAADGSGDLVPTNAWHLDDPDGFIEFRDITSKTRFAPGVGLPGRVLSIGEPVWIPDVQKDANFPRNKIAADIGVRAAFGVPVESEGQVSAVLEFFTAEALEPDEHVLEVVQVLGNQIGQILERQRVGEELLNAREDAEAETRAQLADELRIGETLAQIGAITSTSDITGFYEQFVKQVRELIPCDRMVVSIIDHAEDSVTDRFVGGEDAPGGEQGTTRQYSGSFSAEISTEDLPRYYVGEDIERLADRFPAERDRLDAGYVSVLVALVEWEGETLGFLVLRSRDRDAFSDREAALIGQIASQISGAVASSELNEQLRREVEETELFAELGRVISTTDISAVYERFADQVKELIKFDRIVMSTIDGERNLVVDRWVWGDDLPGEAAGRPYPLADSAADVILDGNTPKRFAGAELKRMGARYPDWQGRIEAGLLSALAAPLIWEDHPIGFIVLCSRDPDAYGDREAELLGRIASQLSGTIESVELAERLQSEVRERDVLAAVGRSVNSDLDLDGVFERIGDAIQTLVPFDRLTYTSLNPETKQLTRTYVRGNPQNLPPPGETYTYTKEGSYGQEFHDPKTDLWEWGFKLEGDSGEKGDLPLPSWVEVPVGTPGESPMGFLSLRSYEQNAYTTSDQRLLSQIATQVAPALRNAIAHDETVTLAEERAALAEISRVINSESDIQVVYEAVAHHLVRIIPYDRLSLSIRSESDGAIEMVYVEGVPVLGYEVNSRNIRPDVNSTYIAEDTTTTDSSDPFTAAGLKACMDVTIGDGERPLGYITVRSKKAGIYGESELELLRRFASQIAPAMENARLIAELEYQARNDSVTSLLNRAGFESSFDNAAKTGDESAGTVIAIVIEQIRELEDRFGVAFADKLLAALGRRLDEEYGDRGIVGRIGHDEFGIGLLGREEAIAWSGAASDIVASCTKPFEIDGELIGLDVSLGVSLYPGHATLAKDLTRMAVLATRSVSQSVDSVTSFNSEMEESASDHVRILTSFRQGMTDREVFLHYQPKVDLATRRIVGAEALVRWQSPERGMVYPGAFLPVLESSGYMWEFTCWTVAEAIEQLRKWSDASQADEWDPVQIAINISARDFQDRRLPSRIMSNLELWGVDPALIEIEVTETAIMEAPEAAIEVCNELKQMGTTIAIDDFGVGQSPLVYLDRLDVDLIKIDRAFVTDIDQSESRQSIVGAMVGLGSQLGMKVLAEGVETEEEAAVIRDTGCHYGQGYLWARAMPADQFQQLLQDGLKSAD